MGQDASTRCSIRTMVVERSARSAASRSMNATAPRRIEIGGRLVQHQDAGARRQRAGQGQALLLPAGQAPRSLPFQSVEPHLVERPPGPAPRIAGRGQAAVLQAEGDVVLDPLHHELAIGVLPDHPDPCRDRGRREAPDLAIVEREVTAHRGRDVARDQASDARARACSCRTRMAPRRASCGPPAGRTRRRRGPADRSLDGRSRGCGPRATPG